MAPLSCLFFCLLCCISLFVFATAYIRPAHKCLPDYECWPNDEAWVSLNASVHGRLLAVHPPAYACHTPHYDPLSCNIAKQRWSDSFWRSDQPGAMQASNWEWHANQSCLIGTNTSIPCSQGAVPVYAIQALQASDVQEGVRFAAKHNLVLVIKSSGHDYLGRSTAYGSLCIWMHHLNTITFHSNFIPRGCTAKTGTYSGSAITAGVGAQWLSVYEAAHANNVVVVGGGGASISNGGGYAQGGGHSIISSKFGLAADNLLEMLVVTADAQLITVNECQNKDLFWALRGGGGGTFGVVVSATHKTHPPLTNLLVSNFNITSKNKQTFHKSLERFLAFHPSLSDAGWAGYFFIFPPFTAITGIYVHPNATDLSVVNDPLKTLLSNENQHEMQYVSTQESRFSSFLEMYKNITCTSGTSCSSLTGFGAFVASRLIPRQNFERSPAEVAQRIIQLWSTAGVIEITGILVAGGAVAKQAKDFNGVNPAWREALLHVANTAHVPDGTSEEARKEIGQQLSDANAFLREITPGSGSYMNEADYWEPDWQQSFFGDHYPKLLEIKKKVDPSGLFACHLCVGSESST